MNTVNYSIVQMLDMKNQTHVSFVNNEILDANCNKITQLKAATYHAMFSQSQKLSESCIHYLNKTCIIIVNNALYLVISISINNH